MSLFRRAEVVYLDILELQRMAATHGLTVRALVLGLEELAEGPRKRPRLPTESDSFVLTMAKLESVRGLAKLGLPMQRVAAQLSAEARRLMLDSFVLPRFPESAGPFGSPDQPEVVRVARSTSVIHLPVDGEEAPDAEQEDRLLQLALADARAHVEPHLPAFQTNVAKAARSLGLNPGGALDDTTIAGDTLRVFALTLSLQAAVGLGNLIGLPARVATSASVAFLEGLLSPPFNASREALGATSELARVLPLAVDPAARSVPLGRLLDALPAKLVFANGSLQAIADMDRQHALGATLEFVIELQRIRREQVELGFA